MQRIITMFGIVDWPYFLFILDNKWAQVYFSVRSLFSLTLYWGRAMEHSRIHAHSAPHTLSHTWKLTITFKKVQEDLQRWVTLKCICINFTIIGYRNVMLVFVCLNIKIRLAATVDYTICVAFEPSKFDGPPYVYLPVSWNLCVEMNKKRRPHSSVVVESDFTPIS